jgi:hypothetical protein
MKVELPPCKSGEDYLGVICADPECGEIIRIDRTWPAQIFENGHAALGWVHATVTCPRCEFEGAYRPEQVRKLVS